MRLARTPTALLLILTSGCLEPLSHEGLTSNEEGPETGPWTDCIASMGEGRTNDPCTFGGGGGSGCSGDGPDPSFTEVSTCLNGELLRTRGRREEDAETCLEPGTTISASLDDDGCAVVEQCGEDEEEMTSVAMRRRRLCEGPRTPRTRTFAEPWDFTSSAGCAEFFDAERPGWTIGRPDDPCVGEIVCMVDSYFVAWCRDGKVALVMDTPFI